MRLFTSTLAVLLSAYLAAAAPGPTSASSTTTTSTSSTTTSTSSSTCTTTPIPNPPSSLHCNQTGSLNPTLAAKIDSISEPHSDAHPLATCQASCLNDSACLSFSYDPSTRYCTRYSKTLRKQGFKKSSKSSTIFSGRGCFQTTCTKPTPTPPPVCTPTPTQILVNGGFEETTESSETPDWTTQGNVTFPNNPQNASSGNYYADLVADSSGDVTSITQSLTGLDSTKQYVLNFTAEVVSFNLVTFDYCTIQASLDGTSFFEYSYRSSISDAGAADRAYFPMFATAQPTSDTADLTLSLQCPDSSGAPATSDASEIYLDNVRFYDPDLSCAMYIQVTPSNSSVDDQYIMLFGNPDNDSVMGFTTNITEATQFSLDPYGNMFTIFPGYETGYWEQDTTAEPSQEGGETIYVNALATVSEDYTFGFYGIIQCSILPIIPATYNLTCSNFGNTYFTEDQEALGLFNASDASSNGTPITLQISYVSFNGTA